MSNEVQVDNQTMNQEDFQKLKEQLSEDKSKKLKEVSENHYKVLDKLNG